VTMIDIQLLQ